MVDLFMYRNLDEKEDAEGDEEDEDAEADEEDEAGEGEEDAEGEEDEDEADEHNGLPYTNKSIHDAYLLQLDETTQNGTNNAILIEAQDRVKNRQKFGEGCSLGEAMHTGTGLDIDDGEELLDDNAEYQNMNDLMNV